LKYCFVSSEFNLFEKAQASLFASFILLSIIFLLDFILIYTMEGAPPGARSGNQGGAESMSGIQFLIVIFLYMQP
jgi:hypothetical protein